MRVKRYITLFVLLSLSITLFGQSIEGVWKGTLNSLGNEIDIYYIIKKGADSSYSASLDVPAQSLKGMKIDSVSFDGQILKMKIASLNASYRGIFIMNCFLGNYTQNSVSIPCNLNKSELPQTASRVQEPLPPYPYREEMVSFTNTIDGVNLAGTLTLPEGDAPFPVVLLISGSGQQNRDSELFGHKPFKVIADYLTRSGIAVLRYDDRGVDQSSGNPIGSTSADFSNDAEAALNYLVSRKEFSQIGLCGHSEGSIISFMVASRNPSVDFVISLAGPAIRGAETLIYQQNAILKTIGYTPEMLYSIESQNRGLYDIICASNANDSLLRDKITTYLQTISSEKMKQEEVNKVLKTYLENWMYFFIKYSPREAIAATQVPILALNGDKDLQVIASINIPEFKKICSESGNKHLTVKTMPGLNHLFQFCSTGNPAEYPQIEQTFSPDVLKIIVDWIVSGK